ncbi:MAG: hypothetical protein AB9860_03365 [Methanomassiliicoccales archaeon]
MQREEDLWLQGEAYRAGLDDDRGEALDFWLLDHIDFKDIIWTSVILGLLSAIVPWWTGMNLILALMATSWLLVLGAVLFITGTILNLRNPMGIIAQIGGLLFFGLEIVYQYAQYHNDPYYDIGDPEIGLGLALASLIISYLAYKLGGYERF